MRGLGGWVGGWGGGGGGGRYCKTEEFINSCRILLAGQSGLLFLLCCWFVCSCFCVIKKKKGCVCVMVCVLGRGGCFVCFGGGRGRFLFVCFCCCCVFLFVCFSSYGSFSVLPHRWLKLSHHPTAASRPVCSCSLKTRPDLQLLQTAYNLKVDYLSPPPPPPPTPHPTIS